MDILKTGFESVIRSKFGVDENDLPDTEINQSMIVDLAEATIKRRVPDYAQITDQTEILFLQNAVIAYICHLLAPSMSRRLETEVQTLDIKWKKDKIDWNKRAQDFLTEVEASLSKITSVSVISYDSRLFGIASNVREPIGVVQQ